ncbi:MAG: helix-turn-helix domain-containing protein [Acidithiobacillus ferrooxidans]
MIYNTDTTCKRCSSRPAERMRHRWALMGQVAGAALGGRRPRLVKLLDNGTPRREVAEHLGVSLPTLYRWVPGASRP